tara:strand:- start:6961 stop:8028 length:1068 start_codon:yes stop_codon:yes gene_type:complete
MGNYTFADRYSEACLTTTPEKITAREAAVKSLADGITNEQILNLVMFYYGSDFKLEWFSAGFLEHDATFSMVNNANESRLLAALTLSELMTNDENEFLILALIVGNFKGFRVPPRADWLINSAEVSYRDIAAQRRSVSTIDCDVIVKPSKLTESLKALDSDADTDTNQVLQKVHLEVRGSVVSTSKQISAILELFENKISMMDEENQMLWWWTGGYSNRLNCSFAELSPILAGVIAALELAELTSYSYLGPLAIPVMIEKVSALSEKESNQSPKTLSEIVDSITPDELKKIYIPSKLSPFISPGLTALKLANTLGSNVWQTSFKEQTGLEPTLSISPIVFAEQLYRERLLEGVVQ